MQRPKAYINALSEGTKSEILKWLVKVDYELDKAKESSRKFRTRLLATLTIAQHLRECVQALEESNADLRAKLAAAKKVTKLT